MPTEPDPDGRAAPDTAPAPTRAGDGEDPLGEAAATVGDRWSLLVVAALLDGPRRFGALLEGIDGLAPNILSRRLKQLDADGLVVAEPYSHRPLRHSYRLTAAGRELAGALRMLAQWAVARRGATPGGPAGVGLAHQACGTAVEARWYCPTCAEMVDDDRTTDLVWV